MNDHGTSHDDGLRLVSRTELCDAPEVTPAQAALNRACGKGPRKARAARKGVLGVSEPTLDRMVIDGRFPKPIRIGPRLVRWRMQTVREWLDERQTTA